MQGKLIIFSAPSGSGKTSIVREIMKTDIPFGFSVSATSREPRAGEVHGKDYYFFTADEFRKKAENGEFLEWEEVYKNQFYGTLKSEVERLRNEGKNVIFDIDVVGGVNVKNYYADDALSIFVKAPSVEELKKRLQGRGTENDESLKKRLDKAEHEMTFADKFDVVIINDDLETAVEKTKAVIESFLR